jgi:hypothetical protein
MNIAQVTGTFASATIAVGLFLFGTNARAQEVTSAPAQESAPARVIPTNNVVLTGYGTSGFNINTKGDHENTFTATVNPIFLYQFQDRVLFEAEFEFELSEGVTQTGLEYGQVDFTVNDHLVLSGGKMLVPFGVFAPRLHPTWINLFPTMPPIFGHEATVFGEPVAPILADIGVMARGVAQVGTANIAFNGFVTQGPQQENMAEAGADEAPGVHFPSSSEDNNTNKMVGGRFDVRLPPWLEFDVSGLTAKYDPANDLGYSAVDVAGELHAHNVDWRTEYVGNWQQVEPAAAPLSVHKHGLYSQVAYRTGAWEPVLRYTRQFDTKKTGEVVDQAKWQAGIGLDYWFSPSVAVMGGYEMNRESGAEVDNDRFVVHLAFGF